MRSQKDAARRRQAAEQEALIDQMCRETELSPSALAKEAGFRNPTITRPRRLGQPVKFETMAMMINAYEKIMSNKGIAPKENVLRYESRYSAADDILVIDPTPDRLKLAIHTASEDFNLRLLEDDIIGLCDYGAELYHVIVELEEKDGIVIPDNAGGRAILRRTLAAQRAINRAKRRP
jgi:hypothetical protein